MPKLNSTKAQQVEEAEETSGLALLPPGPIIAKLTSVVVKDGDKAPYWEWAFEVPKGEDLPAEGRKFWNNTSLSDGALGMPGGIKNTFAAFGASADTDTDELVGEYVGLMLGVETQQKGKRAGQQVNVVEYLFQLDEDGEIPGDIGVQRTDNRGRRAPGAAEYAPDEEPF